MDVLPLNFRVFRFCGAWREGNDADAIVWFLRICYKYAVVGLMLYFTISEVIALILIDDDIEAVTEGLFLVFTFVALCGKLINFLLRQDELLELLDCFRLGICKPRNPAEEALLQKYRDKGAHDNTRWCVLVFMSLSQSTGLALVFYPVMGPFYSERILPLKMYLPYEVANPAIYVATYVQQFLSMTYGVLLNVSLDSLVYGLLIHACGQFELLCHRISGNLHLPTNKVDSASFEESFEVASIEAYVRHHIHVFRLVRRIEKMFIWIVTILFCFSLITLCTSIFQMSKKNLLTLEFLSLVLYLGSMLCQTFLYCWFGNELELKSKSVASAIYDSDWTSSSPTTRKGFLLIMILGQKGATISYYGIFALSLPTFTWLLKTSYSAFSLLQNVST